MRRAPGRLPSRRVVLWLLSMVLLYCSCRTAWTARHLQWHDQEDFWVYQTAASLVHEEKSTHIYDGANGGDDPQLHFISPSTDFSHAARQLGIPEVRMYVYPPVLADLLVPMARLSVHRGETVWLLFQALMLLLTGWFTLQMAGLRLLSRGGAVVMLAVFCMCSVAHALMTGQVTILLLLLWTAGLAWWVRGKPAASAIAVALAASIKLTPLITLLPVVLWRRWRWAGVFCTALLLLVAATAWVNSPSVLLDYAGHVMPAMSRGVPHPENRSLSSAMQMIWLAWHGGTTDELLLAQSKPVPAWLLTFSKGALLFCVVMVVAWVALRLRLVEKAQQVEVLATFGLLTVVISPVAWTHAYVVAYPFLVLLWLAAFRRRVTVAELVLLALVSIDAGGLLTYDLQHMALHLGDRAAALASLTGPALAFAAVALGLRIARRPVELLPLRTA